MNLVFGYPKVKLNKQPWHKMKMVGCNLKEGTKSEALEPIPAVEEAGTGVLHAYLALLDGDHIRETAQHPGAICKHRHFWLITETGASVITLTKPPQGANFPI